MVRVTIKNRHRVSQAQGNKNRHKMSKSRQDTEMSGTRCLKTHSSPSHHYLAEHRRAGTEMPRYRRDTRCHRRDTRCHKNRNRHKMSRTRIDTGCHIELERPVGSAGSLH